MLLPIFPTPIYQLRTENEVRILVSEEYVGCYSASNRPLVAVAGLHKMVQNSPSFNMSYIYSRKDLSRYRYLFHEFHN